jgi:hypothetical protein
MSDKPAAPSTTGSESPSVLAARTTKSGSSTVTEAALVADADMPKRMVTLRLYEEDLDLLRSVYSTNYNLPIRLMVHRHCQNIRARMEGKTSSE